MAVGTLACLGKSEDVFIEDNAGVDAIKAILEKVVNSEDDSEGMYNIYCTDLKDK